MRTRTITIVGGGFSGSMLAVQLARLAGSQRFACDVHVVEPRAVPGPGLAYTARRPEYLLNVRSQFLSAFPDQPDHFLNWLRITKADSCDHSFCSRQSYGRYLQQLIGQVLEWPSPNGISCHWHAQPATAIDLAGPHRAMVELADGTRLPSDFVVLALGNFPPLPPAQSNLQYLTHPNYHGDPWAQGALSSIAADDSVVLIGSGLTAVDVLLGLRADGHRAPITVVSGHGRWPAAHRLLPEASYPSFYAAELSGCTRVAEVLRIVRRHVRAAQAQGFDWRSVIDSLRPYAGCIWATWPPAEQARFLRHLAGIWSVVRHRSPPQSAAALDNMMATGQVRMVRGRVDQILPTGLNQLSVHVRTRASSLAPLLTARHVVACTGPLLDYSRIEQAPVPALRAAGHLCPDPLRLGMQTDEHGALVNAHGQASEVLFTLGSSRRPAYFESTAVPELRQQAEALAQELGRRLLALAEK